MSKRLYILAGCNGAGKTTASFKVLPELINCNEFINADDIAKLISPFEPESVAILAGRIMLSEIQNLIEAEKTFCFETTLAAKSYKNIILQAQKSGYIVTLLFFWLNSVDLALERVTSRVKSGGHYIPADVIKRRYAGGLQNLFKIYLPIVDNFMIFDSSNAVLDLIASKRLSQPIKINNPSTWQHLKKSS
jgi:predicted ABC-type ATPase